jgi:cell division protein FtsI (penicillin-binding protein 3)
MRKRGALARAIGEHRATSGTIIVLDPSTGDILALASWPTYDPNTRNAPPDARRNRVIADTFEPGSTFKIVVVSGALNDGVVRLSDTFDCEHGHFFYGGRTLHDHALAYRQSRGYDEVVSTRAG